MFDHVTIRVADRAASEAFYTTILTQLGIDITYSTGAYAEWRDFSLTQADGDHPPTQRLHVAFVAPTREQVDAFWQAGEDRTTIIGAEGGSFSLVAGDPTAGLHMAFPGDEAAVGRFYADAVAAGYRPNGEPGERPQYHPGYYASYVLDPDGNNIEVVDHHRG